MKDKTDKRLSRFDRLYKCKCCKDKKIEFRSKVLMKQHLLSKHFEELVEESIVEETTTTHYERRYIR